MRRRTLKPWHGLVFFLCVMAAFFLICVPMQFAWGMYGLAATELLILVMALLFAKLMGYPLKVLFPVKRPNFVALLGTVILWISTYAVTMVAALIQYRLFPKQMMEVNGGLNEVIYSVPFLLSVLITVVLPAICEEAVHRGVIIHTLYTVRKEWLVVLIMGIYFGLFHSDPLRFLPTALLGAAISYIMLETENMVYSSFFHGINNLLPLILQQILLYSTGRYSEWMAEAPELSNIPMATIGMYLIFSAFAPFGLYLGNYMIHYEKGIRKRFIPDAKRVKTVLWIVIPTAVMIGTGVLTMIYGILFDPVMKELLSNALKSLTY